MSNQKIFFFFSSDVVLPILSLLPSDLEQAVSRHVPPVGHPLRSHRFHRGPRLPQQQGGSGQMKFIALLYFLKL
jgi:hypothetical protein